MDEIDIDLQLLRFGEVLTLKNLRDEEALDAFIQNQPREVLIAIVYCLIGGQDAALIVIEKMTERFGNGT